MRDEKKIIETAASERTTEQREKLALILIGFFFTTLCGIFYCKLESLFVPHQKNAREDDEHFIPHSSAPILPVSSIFGF
jgi:hypothetical protein